MKRNVIIMGAAGRDFHNFNTYFRNNKNYNVVAFTATQIPNIEGRKYPPKLSGRLYPKGILIYPEEKLADLIRKHCVSEVVLAYSDLQNEEVMQKAALVIASGATFSLLGPADTYIKSKKPVIAVCAVRTGSGKSALSRFVIKFFRDRGYKIAAIRHPMPYGDLEKQMVQRFAKFSDLEKHECTIEEREEYEPHIRKGAIVYAGVDYEKILRKAEKEADVVLWDGGNNDFPFYRPDLHLTIADPHRPGHEISYYPGESNFIMADAIVINKVSTADPADVKKVEENARCYNPNARVLKAGLGITVKGAAKIKGKKVIVVEDGPTLTHGGMKYGAGLITAEKYGAKPLDPRKHAVGSIKQMFRKYKHLDKVLPAMGYSEKQIKELQKTINKSGCEFVVNATPVNLSHILKIKKPVLDVHYEFVEIGNGLTKLLGEFERKHLK